jgi:hypothetical protein
MEHPRSSLWRLLAPYCFRLCGHALVAMFDLCSGPPLGGSGLLRVAGRPSRAKPRQVGGDRALNGVDIVYKASFGRLGVSERTRAFAVEAIDHSPEGVRTHPKLASDDAHGGHSSEFRVALRFHPGFPEIVWLFRFPDGSSSLWKAQ